MAATARIRLHITPFNPDLLDRYVPPSLKPQATNISFHAVETFPERGFGYVELPAMEAQKLKMKLNGTTLKGAKIKIEEAKPEKKRKSSEAVEEDVDDKKARKKAKKEKRKKEQGVIPGHELEEGRRVKRGWDEKIPGRKSESLEGKKMRFKTVVPPNKVEIGREKEKEKKAKSKDDKKEKKSGKKSAVVKEFAKTTKPVNKSSVAVKKNITYEDGAGWVDEDGNVVEDEPPQKKRKRSKATKETPEPVPEPEQKRVEAEDAGLGSEESDVEDEDTEVQLSTQEAKDDSGSQPESESDDAASANPPDSDDEEDEQVNLQLRQAQTNLASNAAAERERSNSILVGDALPSAERDNTPAADKEVHPLEALFKRSVPSADESSKAKKPTPIDTSFSFFNSGADDDEVVAENNPPQTPHTKQDLEWRSIRSAAPTPDTAAIGKRFSFPFAAEDVDDSVQNEDVDMQDASEDDVDAGAEKGNEGEREESEFRKWFYDNRGDLNRSWKKRRREEKKVVRQRENRRLSRRIA